MISKLAKYSKYINLSHEQKLNRIKAATMSELDRAPDQLAGKKFQQQNFVSLSVFDQVKSQNMYKLQTYRHNSKNGDPKAVVALFHGLNSHSNRGAHIAHLLAQNNITTVAYDYRGYGRSQGHRGYIESLDSHLKDSEEFIKLVKNVYPNTPLFAAGISLGGATAYHLGLRHKQWFKGSVLFTPALMPAMSLSKRIGTTVNLLSFLDLFLPSQSKIIPINLKQLGRNPQVYESTLKDQLYIKQRHKLRTILTILSMMQKSPQTFKQYDNPFLVVQGGMDKYVDPHVAFELFSKSKTSDKDILFYEQMWHNVYNEKQTPQILGYVVEWINKRCPK